VSESLASWIFGSLLFVFFVGVFIFAPRNLDPNRQRMLAFASALLAGLFAFFLTGSLDLSGSILETSLGKLGLRATGGLALFVLVLVWWFTPLAPVKVKARKDSADAPPPGETPK
jgi:hypothetical protein